MPCNPSETGEFKCRICSRRYTRKSTLKNHLAKKHGIGETTNSRESLTCPECKRVFSTSSNFKRHRAKAHGIGKLTSSSLSQICSQCDREFACTSSLRKHIDNNKCRGNLHHEESSSSRPIPQIQQPTKKPKTTKNNIDPRRSSRIALAQQSQVSSSSSSNSSSSSRRKQNQPPTEPINSTKPQAPAKNDVMPEYNFELDEMGELPSRIITTSDDEVDNYYYGIEETKESFSPTAMSDEEQERGLSDIDYGELPPAKNNMFNDSLEIEPLPSGQVFATNPTTLSTIPDDDELMPMLDDVEPANTHTANNTGSDWRALLK